MNDKTREEVINAYQTGRSSIQTIARHYNVSVNEVLDVIGEGSSNTVAMLGDQIDQQEAGPRATLNYHNETPVTFTTD